MTSRQPAGGHGRPVFQPQCTHLTMTRLYGLEFVCQSCHRPGPFGWVYRCTQDREELIEQAAAGGYTTAFDELGQKLTEELTVRKRSPAAREDKLSFFQEITPQQLLLYKPNDIATILRQREKLLEIIQVERSQKKGAVLLESFHQRASTRGSHAGRWLRVGDEECQYKVCPCCRPGCADRSFLSLGAIAEGELQPTAATGFGFHVMGERPVVDAKILRNIGQRPSSPLHSKTSIDTSSMTSRLSMMEMLDDQIARCGLWQGDPDDEEFDCSALLPLLLSPPGQLKHSPACENLVAYNPAGDVQAKRASIRTLWTPPPSPNVHMNRMTPNQHAPDLKANRGLTGGRSSSYLETNRRPRNQAHMPQPYYTARDDHYLPFVAEHASDVGLTLPFDAEAFELAQNTPLTPPDVAEGQFFEDEADYERDGPKFTPAPLKVGHGVAVLEESIELGNPDLVTQA